MNYSHVDVFRLFKAPNKWSPEHLTGLHIEQDDHTRIGDIVDDLPKDDDPVFEALAKDFAEPTREQMRRASRGCRRPFWRAFLDLRNATDAFNHGSSVQYELDGLTSEFISLTHSRDIDHSFSFWPIPFHLSSLNIRGKLKHVGYYFRRPDRSLPLVIFAGRKGPDLICSAEEIVPYLLFQAILKYERSPILNSHTAFAVSMKGTTLQFNKAVISREYLKDLVSQKVPEDTLNLLRSESYELLEQDSRRECVRGFLGLMENVRGQFELYENRES